MSTVSRCKLDRDGGKLRDSVGNWFRRGGEGAGPQTEGRHWPAPPPPPPPRCSLSTPARTVTSLYCCTANQIRYSGDVFVSIVRPVKSIKLLFFYVDVDAEGNTVMEFEGVIYQYLLDGIALHKYYENKGRIVTNEKQSVNNKKLELITKKV